MKMKKVTKWLAVAVSATMLAGTLTGCGGSSDPAQSDAPSGEAQESDQGGENETEKAEEAESGAPAEGSDQEPITVTFMRSNSAAQPTAEDNKVVQLIEQKFNIHLELQLIPDADFSTKKSVALASADLPDIIMGVNIDELRQYAPTGEFLNLYDYQDKVGDYLGIVQADDRAAATKTYEIDGGMYGFQRLEYNRIDLAPLVALRMDRLEETGLGTPATWDELYEVMLAIKEKYPDQYVFSTRNKTTYMFGQLAYAMGSGGFPCFSGSGMYYEPREEKWLYGPTQDSFKTVITFLANAYKDGLLDPDYATMDKDTLHEKLSNGSLSMVVDNNSFIGRVYNPALAQVDENARFDIIAPLESKENGTRRALRYERDWTEFTCVNADTKYPERIMELLNWMYTEEGRMVTNFGEEGVDYTVEADGTIKTNPDLIAEHQNDADVFSGIQGALGVGLLSLGEYIDEALYAEVSDPIFIEQGKVIRGWTEEGLIDYNPAVPFFNTEEQEEVTELQQALSNVFNAEIESYINGQKSLDDWGSLVETLKGQGTERLEELFNTAYQRALQ